MLLRVLTAQPWLEMPTGDETGHSKAYAHFALAFKTSPKPDAPVGLWGRINAAQIAQQFKEPAQAMQLLMPISNTRQAVWEGISFKMREGLADGTWHYVS